MSDPSTGENMELQFNGACVAFEELAGVGLTNPSPVREVANLDTVLGGTFAFGRNAGKVLGVLDEQALVAEPFATNVKVGELGMALALNLEPTVLNADAFQGNGAIDAHLNEPIGNVLRVTDLGHSDFGGVDIINAHAAALSISERVAIARSYLASVMVLPASRFDSPWPVPRTMPATVAGARPVNFATDLIRAISC